MIITWNLKCILYVPLLYNNLFQDIFTKLIYSTAFYKEQIIMLNFLNLSWSNGTGNIFKKLSLQETLKYQARKNCF